MSLEVKACAALTEPERAEILALQNEVYSGEKSKEYGLAANGKPL